MEYIEKLNKNQREAATTIDGPMLVLAGAGSGKTHTMISRLAYMIYNGISPKSILLLTFTNKAAKEMIDRAKSLCGEVADDVFASTYHSFCTRMLRQYGSAIGLENFNILTASQATDAISYVKSKNARAYKGVRLPRAAKIIAIFSAMINQDKTMEEVLQMKEYLKFWELQPYLEQLLGEYTEFKKEKQLLDYDDLLVRFYELLTTYEGVRERIENTYKYIMVDEYQDTNNLQSNILMELRKNNKNIAVVGDDAQSIYAFRGANVYNIINFPDQFENCKIVKLTENYRSSNEILDLANQSYKKWVTEGYSKEMKGQFNNGYKPEVLAPATSREADIVVYDKIKEKIREGVSPSNICVISRTSQSFYGLEQMLNQDGVSYDKRGGLKFLETEEVLDMISYLRFSINNLDELALYRILQLHSGIGDVYARRICDGVSSSQQPLLSKRFARHQFSGELVQLHEVVEKSKLIPNEELQTKFEYFKEFYLNLCERVINEAQMSDDTRDEALERLENKKENLKIMGNMMTYFSSVSDFLDSLILDNVNPEEEDEKVVLTTIHSVKGLEFDTVFVLNCVDGVFPRGEAWNTSKEDDQEELRCFYVAITRAKRNLYIVAPIETVVYGRATAAPLSRFLKGSEDYFEMTELQR